MDLLDHVLRRMGRHATVLLPCSLLIGIAFQDFASAMRPLVGPLAVVLLLVTLLRLDWPRVRALLRRPALAIALSVANLVAVPLAVWPLWHGLGVWPGLAAALCLSAMAPGIISAATTAGFLRLDASLVLLISLITNFLVPLTLPPLALWLLGLDLRISATDLSLRLAVIVVLAALGAAAIGAWLGREGLRHNAVKIDGCAIGVLMVFAIPLMDGIVARALSEPARLAGFVAGAFAGMIVCNGAMVMATLPLLDRRTAFSVGYSSMGRHNALLMAVLPATADPDIFLFIAAVQVPLYLMPTLLQPVYRRLLPVAPAG